MKSVAFAAITSAAATVAAAVTAVSTVATATNDEMLAFIAYLARYNKKYDTVWEYNARLENFVYYDRLIK